MNKQLNRPRLLGITYDTVTFDQVKERIEQACVLRKSLFISTVNMNFLTIARRDPFFCDVIAQSDLAIMDGRILQWLTILAGIPAPERITGHDIFQFAIEFAEKNKLSVFLLGGEPGVAQDLAYYLTINYPNLNVTGTHHGFFQKNGITENQELLNEQIRQAAPDLIFVALGAPKQESWLLKHQKELNIPVGVGIGCVFDVSLGKLPRAPLWVQQMGLESIFQLIVAPRRYAKRYLIEDVPTLFLALVSAIRIRITKPSSLKNK
jgi:N-acetylglucosaminyldiphosphoundecaprenol N-acetyl-beta-D-mannosaminyltransferase